MAERLHIYTFSLIYPALLGTFLFAMLTFDGGMPERIIAILMLVYFHAQYGEGLIAATPKPDKRLNYGVGRFVVDLAECFGMVAVFAGIKMLDPTPLGWLAPDTPSAWKWMAFTFAVPIAGHILRTDSKVAHWLMGLSLIAVVGALIGAFLWQTAGLIVIAIALLAYLLMFVLFNDYMWPSMRRSESVLPGPAPA